MKPGRKTNRDGVIHQLLVFIVTLFMSGTTFANPVLNNVAAGSATVQQTPNSTVVNQTSQKTILNWQSFNIGAGEKTHFQQPAGGIALNRINPQMGVSQIYGYLSATGKIILVNQAGIYFGPGSHVDVAGLIASTRDIADSDFLAGRYHFNQPSSYNGSIINEGKIIARQNGLVALVGNGVRNDGTIEAHSGNIILASGSKFTFDFSGDQLINFSVDGEATSAGVDKDGKKLPDGVKNTGKLIANAGTIIVTAKIARDVVDHAINMEGVAQARSVSQKNGVIILDGGDGNVRVAGKIDVSGKGRNQTGGTVKILAGNIHVTKHAVINASGDAGGGEVLIGGNAHGAGPEPNADYVTVDKGATILANASTNGNGGKVVVWSNLGTQFYGSIFAEGGSQGGNGGWVETSGGYLDVNNAAVNLLAPHGITGTWLLDPTNIYIAVSQGSATTAGMTGTDTSANTGPTTFAASGAVKDSLLLTGTLDGALNTSSVIVTTTNASGIGVGNITVVDPVSWSSSTNTLSLNAANNITLNSGGSITNASSAGITLTATGAIALNAPISLTGTLTLSGTNVTQGASSAITANTLVATSSSGSLQLNGSSNVISNLGAISSATSFNLDDSGIASGTTLHTNANESAPGGITITTGSTSVGGYSQTPNVDLNGGSGGITILSNAINIGANAGNNAFQTTGVLELAPVSTNIKISLAGADTYNLSQAAITAFTTGITGAGSVQIGSNTHATNFDISGAVTFGSLPVSLIGGFFANSNAANIITAGTLNLTANNAAGVIGATGNTASIHFAASNISLNSSNGNAFIASAAGTNFNSASNLGTGTLTLTSIAGNVTQSAAGAITAGGLTGILTSGGALNLNSATNAIGTTTGLGAITAPGGFNLTNGNTSTTVNGAISTTNNAVSINVGTGTYTQNDFDISSGSGAITITGDQIAIGSNTGNNAFITSNVLTLKPSSAATTMSLSGSSTFDLTPSEVTALSGGVTGSIVIGDSSASTGVFNIGTTGGNPSFGSQTVTLNGGSFTGAASNLITAGTLNFAARNSGGSIGTISNPIGISVTNLSASTTGSGNAFFTSTNGVNFGGTTSNLGSGTLNYTETTAGSAFTQSGTITGSLAITSTGATTIGSSITTSGAQTYNDPVTITGTTTLASTGSGNINFVSTVDGGFDLTVNTAGITTFGGAVGGTTALTSLTTDSVGSTRIGANISTTAAQTFNDPVTLTNTSTVKSTGGGNINFANTLDGGFALTVDTAGTTTFGGAVGGSTPLTSITTDAPGLTQLGTGAITTSGAQIFNDQVTLTNSPILTSNSSGNITFGSTVNGGFDLTLLTNGTMSLNGIVGGTTPLDSLIIDGSPPTNTGPANIAASVSTVGNQIYNGAVTLTGSGAKTFTSSAGSVDFTSTLDGGYDVVMSSATGTSIGPGNVGGTTPLTSLTLQGSTTDFISSVITTTGLQHYNGGIELGTNSVFTSTGSGNITFGSTIDGPLTLTVNTAGATSFNGIIGGTTPITSLTTDAGGTTSITANITTVGSQIYNDAATITGTRTLTSNSGGNITFNSTLNGATALSINTSAATSFNGTVGGTTPLTSLTTDSVGSTNIGASITTSGAETYNDAVNLTGTPVSLTSNSGGAITFGSTVNGASDLLVATDGTISLNGNVCNTTALNSYSSNGLTSFTGPTNIAGNVTTTGLQLYNSNVTLTGAGSQTFTATSSGNIDFVDTLNGASSVSINTAGTTELLGAVGGTTPLTSLTTDLAGSTFIGAAITTTGAQTYNDPVTITASINELSATNASTGDITFNNTLNGAFDLTILANHNLSFNDVVGGVTPLGNLSLNANANFDIAKDISATSIQTSSAITLTGTGDKTFTTTGALFLGNSVDGGYNLTLNTPGIINLAGDVGAITPLSSLTAEGGGTTFIRGNVTTTGAQTYNNPVNILLVAPTKTLTSTSSGDITFNSTINGARDLVVNTAGITKFNGAVGVITSLTTDAAGLLKLEQALQRLVHKPLMIQSP